MLRCPLLTFRQLLDIFFRALLFVYIPRRLSTSARPTRLNQPLDGDVASWPVVLLQFNLYGSFELAVLDKSIDLEEAREWEGEKEGKER